ncbi:MAG: AMP-binding protein [Pseudarthrobacter sp.]
MGNPVPWLDYQASRQPNKNALVDLSSGQATTYIELVERVGRLAGHLQAMGVGKGDRVAVLAQNDPRVFEVLYACARIGAIMVPVNWRLSTHELRAILADFSPILLVHDDANEALVRELIEGSAVSTTLSWGEGPGHGYESAIKSGTPVKQRQDLTDGDPWVIIYTSGTTGLPKGAVHTFGSVRANIENSAFAGAVGSESVSLTVLPTFHVAGLHLYANAVLMHGGTALIMRSFDAAQTLRLFQDPRLGVTHFCGVPANFQFIASEPGFNEATFLPINAAVGGSPVPRAMLELWKERGINIMSIYGATEAGSSLLSMPPRGSEGKSAVGVPVIHAEATIRDVQGSELPAGSIGELWLRGPMLMSGYWNKPQETATAIAADGWLRTGDAASCDDDGIFHIVDRWKDMYISGGENVYPAEVENVLYHHPAVVLASVIGVADEKWGEAGKAFVVVNSPACSPDELRAWCRERLAAFKVPAVIEILPDLPRNATGKIMKNQLRKVSA